MLQLLFFFSFFFFFWGGGTFLTCPSHLPIATNLLSTRGSSLLPAPAECLKSNRSSSETQGQSVGSAERARRKFSSTGERAPGYRLSPSYFQKFKRMPAPDWAQKMLSPIGEQFLLSSFREFVHDGYCLATLARFVH